MYCPFIREALLQLDPERAHEFAFQQLRHVTGTPFGALVRQKVPTRPVNCMGPAFKNPLGLAAGLDKDGEYISALGAMGFGSIEIGIATPRPQPGNDKPRLFRLVDAEGLVDRMGFNNPGADNLVENVKKAHHDGVLGIDIDKSKDMPAEQDRDDHLTRMKKVYAYAGYTAINISSPDIPGLRTLQYGKTLDDLLTATRNKQSGLQVIHHEYVPIAAKITPDLSEEELIRVTDSLVRHNINGVIATSTTLDRSLVQGMKNCDQTGGLSGRPLQLESTEIIRRLPQELNGRLPVVSVGGIDSVIATREKVATGASLVQVYSGFTFRGPPLIGGVVTHI